MNNIIQIDKKTRIFIEPMNYTIQTLSNSRKGEPAWRSDSFYPSIDALCEELLDSLPAKSSKLKDSLESVVEAVQDARKQVTKILKKHKEITKE